MLELRKPSSNTRRRRTWHEAASFTSSSTGGNGNGNSSSVGARSVSFLRLPNFAAIATSTASKENRDRNKIEFLATGAFLLCAPVLLYLLVTRTKSMFFSSDQMALLIPSLMQNTDLDVGGWYLGSQIQYLPEMVKEPNNGLADYGGLVFVSLNNPNKEFRRTIRKNDHRLYHEEKKLQIHQMDSTHISKRHWFADEIEDIKTTCRRPSWEGLHFPSCNTFHEVDLSRPYDAELAMRRGDKQAWSTSYLSHGYFRSVFAINQPPLKSQAVIKVARYEKHEMNYRPLFNAKRDALIMERLSTSPNIVDIYGHCGASVIVESLPHEVEEVIVPGGGWMKQKDLHDSQDVDIQNHYSVSEKLDIAIEMAQSIVELHGFKDGVIVHDDIQLCQWLRNEEGKLKLGDFNRARLLAWDERDQQYCKYDNGRSFGNYRSPEEYGEKPLSQEHDVWSFGNNIYALLSGLWIFYENEDDEVVAEHVMNGTRPYIDPRYRTRSFIEGGLVDIMEKCWVYDLDQRPEIFEILHLLQKLKRDSNAMKEGTQSL